LSQKIHYIRVQVWEQDSEQIDESHLIFLEERVVTGYFFDVESAIRDIGRGFESGDGIGWEHDGYEDEE